MWELDCEESWALRNWCFWTVVLEKTLVSPLDCKEIQPVHSEGDRSWVFIGSTDIEAQTLQYFGHLMRRPEKIHLKRLIWLKDLFEKTLMLGKIEGRRRRANREWDGCHHQLNGREFEQALGLGDGQGGLACCGPWGCKELDTTERLNWTESESEVAQSCPTLWDTVDGSLPSSSVHRIFQARVLEWVAISFSRGSSQPRDRTWVSHIVGRRFTVWATREAYGIYFPDQGSNPGPPALGVWRLATGPPEKSHTPRWLLWVVSDTFEIFLQSRGTT